MISIGEEAVKAIEDICKSKGTTFYKVFQGCRSQECAEAVHDITFFLRGSPYKYSFSRIGRAMNRHHSVPMYHFYEDCKCGHSYKTYKKKTWN